MELGLDVGGAESNPELLRMEASAQMRIQLRKYIDGRVKSSGTYAREAFAKSRNSSGVTVRRRSVLAVAPAVCCLVTARLKQRCVVACVGAARGARAAKVDRAVHAAGLGGVG